MSWDEKSLEEIAENVKKSITPAKLIKLRNFEAKIKKIARNYGGSDKIRQAGTHKDISIEGRRIGWAIRQKGRENVLSLGTFREAIELTSEATEIPYEQLELYFKGKGKAYKHYKKRFEEEYL